ncbi:penicillin-binding protein activator [Desulfovibrio mangrovi]|uniref:penicillin-binding protein activator n=1 Tax=Desulfovibrio mangrovi TaxID=2976983 RepID=UPI0022454C71|nr:penicillin-binding protein activator [Desulfovibrio mangrovi]UZP65871.1 penicillin-binding protein activator [Desulfovibrio mangrovi]
MQKYSALNSLRRSVLPLFAVLSLLLAITLLAGCQKTVVVPAQSDARYLTLPEQAFAAYSIGDYQRAEALYDRTLQLPQLSPSEAQEAWKYFALSTIANGKYNLGVEALEKWRTLAPDADSSTEWLDAFSKCMLNLPRQKAVDMLAPLAVDTERSWAVRTEASLLLASREWTDGKDTYGAMQTLSNLYQQAPDADGAKAYRGTLENRLFSQLQTAEPEALAMLAGLLTPENELNFPYSVILLEKARRSATDTESWPLAFQALQRLRQAGHFADKLLVERVLRPLEQEFGQPVQGIALALPLTGPYGNIGWKIMRGAGVAQWDLARTGNDLSVTVINTAADGWEEKLAGLPKGISIVGGPLRKDAFDHIKSHGQLNHRNFFTFLSSLGEGEEGRVAWRFFSSPRDQVRTVLEFARNDLGIENYGILYPDEPFGSRMSGLFKEAGAELSINTAATASYAPKDSASWGKTLRSFLKVPAPRPGEDDPMPPQPPFQAAFLPDGWQQMQSLIPHFFFYQETRMVFLGSALWEQGLTSAKDIESRYFHLAVFPGSWNPFTPTTASANLAKTLDESGLGKPDLWVGLGYDFVRFASLLGSPEEALSATEMNKRIQTAQAMDWSIAPIRWNEKGRASQKMFLFTPSSSGFTPLDPERFRERLEQARLRQEERVKMLEEEYQTKIKAGASPQ